MFWGIVKRYHRRPRNGFSLHEINKTISTLSGGRFELREATLYTAFKRLEELVQKNFDLRPAGIIRMLDLRRPIYAQTAAYGHFGRTDIDLPWEHTDKADALKEQAGI